MKLIILSPAGVEQTNMIVRDEAHARQIAADSHVGDDASRAVLLDSSLKYLAQNGIIIGEIGQIVRTELPGCLTYTIR